MEKNTEKHANKEDLVKKKNKDKNKEEGQRSKEAQEDINMK